jgi:hypothetical protein
MVNLPQLEEMPEPYRGQVKAVIEETEETFKTFLASIQTMGNPDQPNFAAAEALKKVYEKIAANTRENAVAGFEHAKILMEPEQIEDMAAYRLAYVEALLARFTRQLAELRELMISLAPQPLNEAGQEQAEHAAHEHGTHPEH